MLEYFKIILSKVSFDRLLFEKELNKAILTLASHEILILKAWCYIEFDQHFIPIMNRCFLRRNNSGSYIKFTGKEKVA